MGRIGSCGVGWGSSRWSLSRLAGWTLPQSPLLTLTHGVTHRAQFGRVLARRRVGGWRQNQLYCTKLRWFCASWEVVTGDVCEPLGQTRIDELDLVDGNERAQK